MNAVPKLLRRVKRDEIRRETFIERDPLEICLDCWKMWLSGDGDKDLGCKTMKLLSGETDAYGSNLDDEQNKRDNEIGAATDAMIDSLSMLHRWAIYEMNSVATVWKFPNADLLHVGPAAQEVLVEKLKKNCCTGVLF